MTTGPWRAVPELGVSFAGSDVLVLCYHEVRRREFAAFLRGTRVLSGGSLIGWKIPERPFDRALARAGDQAPPT